MIMGFIIWSVVCALFFYIGISCLKSNSAVGFFTFGKPPVTENIKGYNKAVAKLWFVYAILFEIIGLPLLKLEQNSPRVILLVFAILIWVISLIAVYLKIESKYRK